MQEYKICPFCKKAVEADNEHCPFCGGLLEPGTSVRLSAREADAINRPGSTEIKPVKEISGTHISTIQILSLTAAVLCCVAVYAISRDIVEVGGMFTLLFSSMAFIAGTWISFAMLLKKFSGTADIARPLLNTNFYFLGASLLLLPWSFILSFSGRGPALIILSLIMLGALATGSVLWFIAAVRMINRPNNFVPLPVLGKVTIGSIAGYFIVAITEGFNPPFGGIPEVVFVIISSLLTITPFVTLAWLLGQSRKCIVAFQTENRQ